MVLSMTRTAAPVRGESLGSAGWLSGALAVVAAVAAAATMWIPGVLRGPAAVNGSAQGTALVVLVVAVPLLIAAMISASSGSARALIVWLGALGYLLYNAVMFLFATPFNRLFLPYVAMLSLCLWSVLTLLVRIDVESVAGLFSPRTPVRGLAAYTWVVVGLNVLAWMRMIVPGLVHDRSPAFLAGTGMTTNPVFVQDLAFWLPLMAVAALWLYRRRPWGYLVVGSVLIMWVIEAVSVAVDQWIGHVADPASPAASAAVVPMFAVLATVGLVPLWYDFRAMAPVGHRPGTAGPIAPGR